MARSRRAEPMDQLVPVLLLAALFLVIVALMGLGWRRRGRRQADLPAPRPDTPLAELGETEEIGPLEAVYVTTVLADQPLERVVAHGLGARSTRAGGRTVAERAGGEATEAD